MKKILALVLAMAMVFALCACGAKEAPAAPAEKPAEAPAAAPAEKPAEAPADPLADLPEVKVLIPTAGAAANIEAVYTEKWMALVTERTNGKVTFDYTNGGALGSYAELVDGVNMGAYDMTVTDISQLQSLVPEVAVLGLPFLMKDYDHLKAVYSGEAWDWIKECVANETNTMLMTPYFCGFREVLTADKLATIDDFQGYVIRVPQADNYIKPFDALGFAYTTLAWSECYTSMQTGVINGLETAVMSFYTGGFYDLGKFVLLSHHMQAVNTVLVNQDFWNGLPEEYKTIMTEAFEELQAAEWDECIANEDYYREQMEAEGVEFTELPAEDVAKINELVKPYWDEVTASIEGGADWVAKILDLA